MVAPELAARVRQLGLLPPRNVRSSRSATWKGCRPRTCAASGPLGECEGCAEHLRQIRITVAVTGRIREEELARPRVRTSWTSTAAGSATGNLKEP